MSSTVIARVWAGRCIDDETGRVWCGAEDFTARFLLPRPALSVDVHMCEDLFGKQDVARGVGVEEDPYHGKGRVKMRPS